MVTPQFLTASTLRNDKVRHGFFMRTGGVCQGLQDAKTNDLSVGFSEKTDPKSIQENRKRIEYEFGAPFVTAHQVHGAHVIHVTENWDSQTNPPEADGLVTRERHLGLGILTADCGPLLLADVSAGVIGACHVGWKGLKAGVIEATISAMIDLGAARRNICAALGPCMGRVSYEVSLDFPDNFIGVLDHHRSFFRPSIKRDKLMFDMPRAIRDRLERASIRHPEVLARDTFSEKNHFFSYRRATYNGEADYGRQISLIALK